LNQSYSDWDLVLSVNSEIPEWLHAWAGNAINRGRSVDLVGSYKALKAAALASRAEFIVMLGHDVVLEPRALEYWLAAMSSQAMGAYSDWDHIDSSGRRHGPVFTPELSTELLRRSDYWGGCFIARSDHLLALEWPVERCKQGLTHQLALGLCQTRQLVHR